MVELRSGTLLPDPLELFEQARQHGFLHAERQRVGIRHPQTDLVARLQPLRPHNPLAIHERPVSAVGVFQHIALRILQKARVAAGNAAVEQHQVVVALPAKGERRTGNLNLALIAKSVTDGKPRK